MVSKNIINLAHFTVVAFLVLATIGLLPPQQNKACAASTGGTTLAPVCDPTFMRAMKTKAWMEAQREMMIAQSTIAKPDSVFALSCFGRTRDQFRPDFTLGNVYQIMPIVTGYVNAGFAHTYGGGHLPGQTMNNGENTQCGLMMTIWNAARCADAARDRLENIRTLLESSQFNRGPYPRVCQNFGTWPVRLNLFSNKIPNQSVGAAYNDMNIFLRLTAPLSEAGACATGIPTGVTFPPSGTPREVVCPNPGCYADAAGTCQPSSSAGQDPGRDN